MRKRETEADRQTGRDKENERTREIKIRRQKDKLKDKEKEKQTERKAVEEEGQAEPHEQWLTHCLQERLFMAAFTPPRGRNFSNIFRRQQNVYCGGVVPGPGSPSAARGGVRARDPQELTSRSATHNSLPVSCLSIFHDHELRSMKFVLYF